MSTSIPPDLLPNGERFAFWDDATDYARTYHVAQNHPAADDDNPGTGDQPFRTINRAAELLGPGEKVLIHDGVYRECVRPARGGSGPDRMIAYEAAPGAAVVVSGAREWQPDMQPSSGWNAGRLPADVSIWMADLPAAWFVGYNPFLVRNAYEYFDTYAALDDKDFLRRAMLRRGMIFHEDQPLKQVYRFADLAAGAGCFWVEEPGCRIHFRLPEDLGPADLVLQGSVHEQVFAPAAEGLGYIRVAGIRFEHAADGLPVPQRAAVSTGRGHHWIIEDNQIEWANACGMDLGAQHWSAATHDPCGCHIVRRNRIRNCGICGIAGCHGVHDSLIEDNLVEDIGFHNLERMWECGGLKFHRARRCLIRRNVFRHLRHAGGIWLDCSNDDCRVTNNVVADVEALLGAVFSEMNFGRNLIDHNIFWDIRNPARNSNPENAPGVKSDCNEKLIVANNFIAGTEGGGVMITLNQADRKHTGRTAVGKANQVLNNVIVDVPLRLRFGRREENVSDGNLYQTADDSCSFNIKHPEPENYQHLAGWQEYFGLDQHSAQARITADFDTRTLTLTWSVAGDGPACQPIQLGDRAFEGDVPGPFDPDQWRQSLNGGQGAQTFPVRDESSKKD